MLKVKTYLDKSTIPNIGIGLFAAEKIEKDTVIWEFVRGLDFIIPIYQVPQLDPIEQDFISKYGYFDEADNSYVVCIDNDRFTNHSENPNTRQEKKSSTWSYGRTFASKVIEKGEEIFCDYFEFDGKAYEKLNRK